MICRKSSHTGDTGLRILSNINIIHKILERFVTSFFCVLSLTLPTSFKVFHVIYKTHQYFKYETLLKKINPFLANTPILYPPENTRKPHKKVKYTQRIHPQKPTNYLSVFDHFVGVFWCFQGGIKEGKNRR